MGAVTVNRNMFLTDLPGWIKVFKKEECINLGAGDYIVFHLHLFGQVLAIRLSAMLMRQRICPCDNVTFTRSSSHGGLNTLLLLFNGCRLRTKHTCASVFIYGSGIAV